MTTTKPIPDLPAGFDFTDPDIHAERLPVELSDPGTGHNGRSIAGAPA